MVDSTVLERTKFIMAHQDLDEELEGKVKIDQTSSGD